MKTNSKVFTVLGSLFLAGILALLIEVLYRWSSKESVPLVWKSGILIVGFATFFRIFNEEDDEDNFTCNMCRREESQDNLSQTKIHRLKWSTLMGPCTWELAQKTINRKKKDGWRLPTKNELDECKVIPVGLGCWLGDSYVFYSGYKKDVVATRNVKHHFYLVREI